MAQQLATFGAGCFWCLEAAMNQLHGVLKAYSGYMGGDAKTATYEQVCRGNTDHAEVVQITYDDKLLDFSQLCLIFFSLHDPTQLNRQGNDVGRQYRSVIFYHTSEQQQIAEKMIADMTTQQLYPAPVVTQVDAAQKFYQAEAYHQGYFLAHPEQAYCQYIIAPKMARFRQHYQAGLKA